MAGSVTGGSVVWNFDVDTKTFDSGLENARKKVKDVADSASNAGKQIKSGFGTPVAQTARELESGFANVATALGGILKPIGLATVAGAGLITAFTIKGGIDRALNIEDAQAKLRGLGHDANSVKTIMDSALTAVKGTAFGLDAAATAAASAVAAGIKPGQELTRYLSLAGDAATIAGTSFQEMGSIFGKVQTQQRAYTQELNMLADRGIPIYQWLQEELGVTQEALREMVAKGEVDAKTYFSAIEKNIGGAALESGKTTRGSWANMQAAMSRVGAAIVEDIIPRVRDSFGNMTKWFDENSAQIVASVGKITDKVLEFANFVIRNFETIITIVGALGAAFVAAKIGQGIAGMVAAIQTLIAKMAIFRTSMLAGATATQALNVSLLANPIGLIVAAVVALIGVLVYLQVKFNIFGKAFKALEPVINIIKQVFSDLWTEMKRVGSLLADELAPVFEFVSRNMETFKKIGLVLLAAVLTPLIAIIASFVFGIKVLAVILGFIADHFETIKKVIMIALAVAFAPLLLIIGAVILIVKYFGTVIQFIGNIFMTVFTFIWTIVSFVFNFIIAAFNLWWSIVRPILEFFMNLVIIVFGTILIVILTVLNKIFGVIQAIWGAIWGFISAVLQWIWDRIVQTWNFYFTIISTVLNKIWSVVSAIWNAIFGFISGIVSAIVNWISSRFNAAKDLAINAFNNLKNGVSNIMSSVSEKVRGIIDSIKGFFSGAGSWLYDAGRKIIQGLVDGIKGMADAAKNAAKGVMDKVRNLMPFSPAKEGPFSGKGWTLYSGQSMIQGLAQGIQKEGRNIQGVMDSVLGGVQSQVGVSIAPSVEGANAGGAPITNNIREINIASEVDGENWLKRLTREEEITSNGLTPYAL